MCDAHLELRHYTSNPRLCVRAMPSGVHALAPGFESHLPLLGGGLDEDFQVWLEHEGWSWVGVVGRVPREVYIVLKHSSIRGVQW